VLGSCNFKHKFFRSALNKCFLGRKFSSPILRRQKLNFNFKLKNKHIFGISLV
jgi:hypothetical protein